MALPPQAFGATLRSKDGSSCPQGDFGHCLTLPVLASISPFTPYPSQEGAMRLPLALTAALLTIVPPPLLRGQVSPSNRGGTPLLRYDRIGSGPPLLLLHGFGGCAQDWRLFDSTFRTKYQLI